MRLALLGYLQTPTATQGGEPHCLCAVSMRLKMSFSEVLRDLCGRGPAPELLRRFCLTRIEILCRDQHWEAAPTGTGGSKIQRLVEGLGLARSVLYLTCDLQLESQQISIAHASTSAVVLTEWVAE